MTHPLSEEERFAGGTNDRIGTRLVHDADGMRVWHLRLDPGESLPPHRHDRPYFWTVLTDGMGRSRYDDGRIVDVAYTAGDTRHFADLTANNAFVHDLANIGPTPLVFVTVEFTQAP